MAGLPDTLPASTVMNLNVIEDFLRRHRHADIIEAVVDTTWANDAVVPFLNLWAWKVSDKARLDDAQRTVCETGDPGFWYDLLDEAGSLTFEVEVAAHYPDWPAGIAAGDATILARLSALARPHLQQTSGQLRVVFHHVDAWPLIEIDARDAAQNLRGM
ncbi:MAG: hypothetical protein IPL70_03955 [Uliginosibacterium sp.]|nr:hypothetical protein [Uliginosibacterium sp.]